MIDVNIFLFSDFETLDAFGPAEILGKLDSEYHVRLFSVGGGPVLSRQAVYTLTEPAEAIDRNGILLIPGGMGTRTLVSDGRCIQLLKELAEKAPFCLTVCTGSALLAKTGLLDGLKATTNKKSFRWVQSVNPKVSWVEKSRWVADGKFYTSSGVSAGMDMALGFIKDRLSEKTARAVSDQIEYVWNDRPGEDPFAKNIPSV